MSGTTLPITESQFRQTYVRAMNDPSAYPSESVVLYLGLAGSVLDPNVWGDYYALGAAMFAAHFLALDRKNDDLAASGGAPGTSSGVVQSKSVGPASLSFDLGSIMEQGAGHWNETQYGRRFYRLMMIAGMGGVQVTGTSSDAITAAVPPGSNWFG